ncbi:MFS transporter [Notoacmeibacter ruber]|uniref:MFS transporter n=1 Tax=Notoacmeibacter ruber TaxID=2670375 RepID=A0A3L7JA66_9HYPH|nr:MFS transporter [Notoacmeibacter ruber]RLQ87314.1 MFS transporter [Notoacmeibacter ruber]
MTSVAAEAEDAALSTARHTALILSAGQAIVGAAAPICISLGAIAGSYLLGDDKSLATAPVAGYSVGIALGALPAAALMRAIGRRRGFVSGAFISALGGILSAMALFSVNFWLFAIGLLTVGIGGSFVQQYRFAAADASPARFKPKAISWVLAGGVFAAIIGPQLVIWTKDAFAPAVPFAGAFVGLIALALIGAFLLNFMRLPPAKATAGIAHAETARPLGEILTQPRFMVGLLCAIGSYSMMSFVMTGAPLAMVECGHSADEATLGISWHVLAMFAPSFFTGRLIERFGKVPIVLVGLGLLAACSAVALAGLDLANFWLALILLGFGWNFGFIGATAIVSETYSDAEKSRVQGVHDFMLFGMVAFASLMSGQVLNTLGWYGVVMVVFPVVAICVVALIFVTSMEKKRSAY